MQFEMKRTITTTTKIKTLPYLAINNKTTKTTLSTQTKEKCAFVNYTTCTEKKHTTVNTSRGVLKY